MHHQSRGTACDRSYRTGGLLRKRFLESPMRGTPPRNGVIAGDRRGSHTVGAGDPRLGFRGPPTLGRFLSSWLADRGTMVSDSLRLESIVARVRSSGGSWRTKTLLGGDTAWITLRRINHVWKLKLDHPNMHVQGWSGVSRLDRLVVRLAARSAVLKKLRDTRAQVFQFGASLKNSRDLFGSLLPERASSIGKPG